MMDLTTCFKKLEYVGVLAFATAASDGSPQIRNISAVHIEDDKLYFFTARGKDFCRQLLSDGRVQILAYTKYKEMIRLSGRAYPVPEDKQRKWIDTIFEEQPYLYNVYPNKTNEIGIVFEITEGEIEYFNLGVKPIFRESYSFGKSGITPKGYEITDKCIGCGRCLKVCPQGCIEKGKPFKINKTNCLHCGACFEACPQKAVVNLGSERYE